MKPDGIKLKRDQKEFLEKVFSLTRHRRQPMETLDILAAILKNKGNKSQDKVITMKIKTEMEDTNVLTNTG